MALEAGHTGAQLADLLARVRSIETGGKPRGRGGDVASLRVVASGWGTGDWGGADSPREAALGPSRGPSLPRGLERGLLHEFCGPGDGSEFGPPLALLVHLARAALMQRVSGGVSSRSGSAHSGSANSGSANISSANISSGHVAFVGRRVWPYPAVLTGDAGLVESAAGLAWIESDAGSSRRNSNAVHDRPWMVVRALYIDTRHGALVSRGRSKHSHGAPSALLWAADRALRCSALAAVVIDGGGLTLAATRRLQLAAEAGDVLALVARPASDATRPSAAATRWIVERSSSPGPHPAWNLVPLRQRATRWLEHGA